MPESRAAMATTTRLSRKGRVILPKAIREKRRWSAGTHLTVEETPDGVLLKPAPLFPPTKLEDVFGMLKYDGPTVTIEEMHQGILEEAARRHARSRS